MNRRIAKLSCFFGVLALLSACLTPVGTSTTGLDGAVAASPEPQDTKEDSPEGEGLPKPEFTIEVAKEPKERQVAEASPTWMAPTDGFIWCVETLTASMPVSLEERKPLTAEGLEVSLKVKNPETGEEEELEAQSLSAEVEVTLPEGLFLDGGTIRRLDEGASSGSEKEAGPTSLRLVMKISSKRPPDPTLRDPCSPEIAYMRSRIFVVEADYRRRLTPYSGRKEFQLSQESMTTSLEPLILNAQPLLAPDRVLKGRLTR